uniref:Uncharacterized protein n=1 Tax=Anguilla anguilla TaxID=7936 RepID=A0A0E9P9F3_ANGAN
MKGSKQQLRLLTPRESL